MRRCNIFRRWVQLNTLALASLILLSGLARSEDWPMWRHDASRSSATREQLPASLSLQWSRQLVESRMAWPEDPRIHFDSVSEPVYAGGLLFVPSASALMQLARASSDRLMFCGGFGGFGGLGGFGSFGTLLRYGHFFHYGVAKSATSYARCATLL